MIAEIKSLPFRALILEDDDFQRRIGVRVLADCGAGEVLEAANCEVAFEILNRQHSEVEILLCDLNLPGVDGLALLRQLSEVRHRVAIVLVSALDPPIIRAAEVMATNYGLTLVGVIEKPLSRVKLSPLLERFFAKGTPKVLPTIVPPSVRDLQVGLAEHQFLPYFQPIVDVANGELVGVEALMRWRHPVQGLLAAGSFIPMMEANGLLREATFELIAESLAAAAQWRGSFGDVPVAINFSASILADRTLPEKLEAMTHAAGLTTSALSIEITESVAMIDIGSSLETLARCRMKGLALAIDDYGTGFSSMQQLTRLPVSEIKIDQSFVTGAAKNALLTAMINTTVSLARLLNVRTVAEGIESQADWDLVRRLGCPLAQGYFIGSPMPQHALQDWYAHWRAVEFPRLNGPESNHPVRETAA